MPEGAGVQWVESGMEEGSGRFNPPAVPSWCIDEIRVLERVAFPEGGKDRVWEEESQSVEVAQSVNFRYNVDPSRAVPTSE